MIENAISTNENIVQDNSSIEYVSPETNPIATVQSNELIFGQKHNDIDCALCPTAKRACDRAWFTEAQICEWSGMSHSTMYRRIKLLEEKGRITSCSDLNKTPIPDSLGVLHETTIYNLNVLNQLAMVCIESDVLNETSKKFSDILSEVATTGSYSIRKPDSYMIEDKIERAKRWIEETEEWQKALSAEETAHAETKALLAEEKEKSENLERTKSQIGDKKVASAMGTARSGLSQPNSPKSARLTQIETNGAGTPVARNCFPNGRATFWTKYMKTTARFFQSTE